MGGAGAAYSAAAAARPYARGQSIRRALTLALPSLIAYHTPTSRSSRGRFLAHHLLMSHVCVRVEYLLHRLQLQCNNLIIL